MVKLLDRLNQAQIALLNQVEELHPAADIPFCNTDHQTQVGFRKAFAGFDIPFCHPDREVDLLIGREQWHPTDLLQIDLDRVIDIDAFGGERHVQIGVLADVFEVLFHRRDHILHDLDVVLLEHIIELIHLLNIVVQLLERVAQFLGGQLALGLSGFDQLFE